MNRIRLLVQAIVMVGILTGCDSCGDLPTVQNITINGHRVLVQSDTGTTVPDNVMSKLNAAINTNTFQSTIGSIPSTVYTSGLTIIIENSGTSYSSCKVRGSQIMFHIDFIGNNGTSDGSVATALLTGINNVASGTNFGLAPVQKTPGGAGLSLNLTNTRSNSASPSRADYSPYGTDYNPYGVDLNPCGADYSPCGVDLNPCGVGLNPCGVDLSPCGADYSPCGVDLSPCGADYRPLLRRVA